MSSPYRERAAAAVVPPEDAPLSPVADRLLAVLGAGMVGADALDAAFGVATVAGALAIGLALASLRAGSRR